MTTETTLRAVHHFLDAEMMLEQRRTEAGDVTRPHEAFERAKGELTDALRGAAGSPSERPLVAEAEAYLAATTAFEQSRTSAAGGAELAGPARRLERAQQSLQDMLNRYAREAADRDAEPPVNGKRLLVGVDGSLPSSWAVEAAGRLALELGATVKLVHVRPSPATDDDVPGFRPGFRPESDPDESEQRQGEAILLEAQLRLPRDVESSVVQRWGNAAVEIVNAARRWGADFVVVGTRGRGRVSRFVVGSTADSVVRLAPCPVITVAHEPAGLAANEPHLVGRI